METWSSVLKVEEVDSLFVNHKKDNYIKSIYLFNCSSDFND